jgi:hypothetical protein
LGGQVFPLELGSFKMHAHCGMNDGLLASFENASFAMLHLILKHAADVINEILIEEGKTFYMTNYG